MNKLFISIAMGLAFAAGAQASIITVEPDSFANGADISNATAGVTLQLETGNPVYAYDTGDSNHASTGTQVFGYDVGFGVEPYWDNQNIFRATFTSLVDFVSIDVVNNNGVGQGTDIAYMEVWGLNGLLATINSSTIGFPGHETLSFQTPMSCDAVPNISYIRMSSSDGSDFNLDRLQFGNNNPPPPPECIPEPGSLALIGIGALGLFSRRGKARMAP